ncbi:hypothetical protein M422DRAFT_36119 [Sphaerobolus stellatus SS14]|uniref:Uncharacterized protein n=1 Tax=Sphaerobolus stellatus (strain SS14) TaxID=990650 RepID=A0A0C9V2N8_SPHS4|nr:hypothetical protein M422DRAFT_36119 [Sphaerobolus stellatus SS14]
MSLPSLKLTTECSFCPENYPSSPHVMEMSKDQWEKWFAEQSIVTSWQRKGKYTSSECPSPAVNAGLSGGNVSSSPMLGCIGTIEIMT